MNSGSLMQVFAPEEAPQGRYRRATAPSEPPPAETPALVGWLQRCVEWVGARLERQTPMLLVAFVGVYLCLTCTIAALRPLWFDELFTHYLAQYRSLSELWSALASIEPNPPLGYFLTRAAQELLGATPLAVRLPEVLGFLVLSLCVFRFVARRCSLPYAWAAMALPLTTLAYGYAFEGRPYGLMLGFGGLALVCWQTAADGRPRRRLALVGLTLSLAAAVSCHYYAVLFFLPLGLGELVRLVERRRVDIPLWTAVALGGVPLAVFYPLMAGATSNAGTFWARVAWRSFNSSYETVFGPAIFPLVIALAVLALVARPRPVRSEAPERRQAPLPLHEIVAVIGLALLPVIAVVLGKLVTGVYVHRYVLMAAPAFGILGAFVASRFSGASVLPGAVLTTVLLGWFAATATARVPLYVGRTAGMAEMVQFLDRECAEPLPIAVAEPNLFLTLAHAATPAQASRLVSVNNAEAAVRYLGHDTSERALRGLRTLIPFKVSDYADFTASQRRFYVYGEAWLTPTLLAEGAQLQPLARHGRLVLFLATLKGETRSDFP